MRTMNIVNIDIMYYFLNYKLNFKPTLPANVVLLLR